MTSPVENQVSQPKEAKGNKLLSAGFVRTFALFVNIGSALITMPILIHGLGDRGYGMWALIGSLVAYYGVLDFGLAATNEKFITESLSRKDKSEARAVFSSSLVANICVGAFFLLVTIVVSLSSSLVFADPMESRMFQLSFLILGANFALTFPFYTYEGVLAAHLRFSSTAMARVASIVIRTILAIVVVHIGYGLVALSLTVVIATFVFRIIVWKVARQVAPDLTFSKAVMSRNKMAEMFHHGKYVFLGNLSTNAHFRFANLIVTSVLGLSAVTYYAVAARLAEYLQNLVQTIFRMVLPALTSLGQDEDTGEFNKAFLLSLELNVQFAAMLFSGAALFGGHFVFLWLGEGFTSSYYIFLILAAGLAIKQMQTVSLQALMSKSRHQRNNLFELAEGVSAIALAVLLAQSFGLLGIAIGISTAMGINKLLIQPFIICRELGIRTSHYYGILIRGAAPHLLLAVALWVPVEGTKSGDVVSLLGWAILYTSLTLVLLWLTLRPKTRDRLLKSFARKGH